MKATPDFPIEVAKGGSQSVSFSFDEDSVDRDAICAGQVRLVGSVMDTLKGATDPVSSVLITPDCGRYLSAGPRAPVSGALSRLLATRSVIDSGGCCSSPSAGTRAGGGG